MNPINIWGKVVLYMRQSSQSALHVICGSINNVAIQDDSFIINVYDEYVRSYLTENLGVLQKAFTWQDLSFNLKVVLVEKQVSPSQQDIIKLKNLVGEYLKVIGDNENGEF